jgi:uncharacterized phage protein (TIGR01671 family)
MNREIKFRAWNPDDNKMEYPLVFAVGVDGILKPLIRCRGGNAYKDYPKMQFTGLHDKNGKEIYEGDIICNDKYDTWEWRGVVKFSHGVFGAEWLVNIKKQSMVGAWGQKHNLRRLDDDIIEGLIVIGNIYENPNLLL